MLLSTDTGGVGLNLQNASVVINCDLPWNPARLEQRIARAWRKDQTSAVTVLNLVSERTIEHRMLGMLARKQALSDGVLDQRGDLSAIKMTAGGRISCNGSNNFSRISHWRPRTSGLNPSSREQAAAGARRAKRCDPPAPTDQPRAFCQRAVEALGGALVACEERFPSRGESSVLLVVVERERRALPRASAPAGNPVFQRTPRTGEPAPSVQLEVVDRATAELLRRWLNPAWSILPYAPAAFCTRHPASPPSRSRRRNKRESAPRASNTPVA